MEFSQEEKERYANIGGTIAAKAVLTLLRLTIQAIDGLTDAAKRRIEAAIDRLIPARSGCMTIDIDDQSCDRGLQLAIALHEVPKDYRTEVSIPTCYVNDLMETYNNIKMIAITYWKYISQTEPDLREAADRFPQLTVDPVSPTTMYFDQNFEKRIGIAAVYLLNGKLYVNKNDCTKSPEV